MSRISYRVEEAESPTLGSLGDRRAGGALTGRYALALVHVPLAISLSVNAVYFVFYWQPEFAHFWGYDALLSQVAPLASKELTSQSTPLVAVQVDRSGWAAAYLLLAALALPPLARARHWWVRLALWPVSYLAVLCGVVLVLGVLVRGQLGTSLLGVLLLGVWGLAAVVTTWRSLWVEVESLPARPVGVGWLLAAYAVLNPLPVAVGRRLFAPELREAALAVRDGGFALRWSALITPATLPLYLAGVLVGVLVSLVYLLLPPPRTARPRRTAAVVVAVVLALALCGAWASTRGADRVQELRTGSPVDTMAFSCGSTVDRPPGRPARSLIGGGAGCRRLSSYLGYQRIGTRELPGSLSPVKASTPEGQPIAGSWLGTFYGSTLVVVTTDRLDNQPDTLVGLSTADLAELWQYRCRDGQPFGVRFAGSDGIEDRTAGRFGTRREGRGVLVACGDVRVRLDPRTGRVG
ncbi:MAG: hypothetical protein ACLGIF_08565 [Actinomycetes bacterium]